MRHKPNFAEVASIKQVGFESVWTSLFSKEMLNKAEVKFILKNFDAVIQKPDFEKSQSVALLNLAFDWLGKLPSTKLRGSVSNFFSSKENKDQDVAHPDFDGYMGYVAPPKNGSVSFLLVEYCAYQARKKGVMKTYEADFVKKYSQHLSQHDGAFNAYNSETFNEALSLADSVKSTALNKK